MPVDHDPVTALMRVLPVAVVSLDADHRIQHVNAEAESLLATGTMDARGRPVLECLDGPDARLGLLDLIDELGREVRMRPGVSVSTLARDIRYLRGDGHAVTLATTALHVAGPGGRVLLSLSTSKQERDRHTTQLVALQRDSLTGLPTRPVLLDALRTALARLNRHPGFVGVVFVDLDRMKAINDRLGHESGDRFLCDVASRIRSTLREEDIVARFGGDEFVIVIPEADSPERIVGIVRRLSGVVAHPMITGGETIEASASIGIVITEDPLANPEGLIRDADTAMYESKRKRAGVPVLFDPALRRAVGERVRVEADLRQALVTGEIEPHFQPIVSFQGGIKGAEALVRWRHPDRGLLTPDAFISLAEETGLVHDVWHAVLEEACRSLRGWRDQPGREQAYMSVNLSPRQFGKADLVPRLTEVVARAGLAPSGITVEVTETALFEDAALAHRVLDAIAAAGFGIALDDFGTGYSSLSHLQDFPVTMVKIDRSFISRITDSPRAAAIARAIIDLGLALGLETCAEGVETIAQADALADMGCSLGQGYLWGAAEPAGDFTRRLAAA